MEKRIEEAIRYLGVKKGAADAGICALVERSFQELEKEAEPRSVCRIFELRECGEETVQIGTLKIQSRSLSRNLKNCGRAILFGATLGIGVDRLISRTGITDMARSVALQACAAAYLEEYCDRRQEEIGRGLEKEGGYLRPRFSPGYGDFDIRYQEPIMRMLDCAKMIGLSMTDGCMMTPTKSVTAVIGVSPVKERCPVQGCEACGRDDCPYRRRPD